jgi:hypothetical protein
VVARGGGGAVVVSGGELTPMVVAAPPRVEVRVQGDFSSVVIEDVRGGVAGGEAALQGGCSRDRGWVAGDGRDWRGWSGAGKTSRERISVVGGADMSREEGPWELGHE